MELINSKDNIFGCYISGPSLNYDASEADEVLAQEKNDLFREYIWGNDGIDHVLKELKHEEYGQDIKLILFQFLLNPLDFEVSSLKEIEGYRKREKSIGVNIIITDNNFFEKNHIERISLLKESILDRLRDLKKIHQDSGKLDTRFDLLENELVKHYF